MLSPQASYSRQIGQKTRLYSLPKSVDVSPGDFSFRGRRPGDPPLTDTQDRIPPENRLRRTAKNGFAAGSLPAAIAFGRQLAFLRALFFTKPCLPESVRIAAQFPLVATTITCWFLPRVVTRPALVEAFLYTRAELVAR